MINELLLYLTYLAYGFHEFSGPPWNDSSPCPTAVVVRPHRNSDCVENPTGAYCRFPNMTLAHQTLTKCPNIDTLDVSLDYMTCTGVETDRSDFPFVEGERYPALKSLKLDGYNFGGLHARPDKEEIEAGYCMGPVREGDPWDAQASWSKVGDWVEPYNNKLKLKWEEQGGRPKTNLDMWIEAMDWSQLEELSINTWRTEMVDVIAELPSRLSSLKTLHIDSLPFIKGLKEHTLESLHWVGPTQPNQLSEILTSQGLNLKTLEYRCDELYCPLWPSHTPIAALSTLAPALQHIAINLPREPNATWPLAHLSSLARIPSLESADLYFRLQSPCTAHKHFLGSLHPNCAAAYRAHPTCYGPDRFEVPYLNDSTAAYMFSFLRSENSHGNLTSVTFRTGDWAPPVPQVEDMFVARRRAVVECRVERGREVCEVKNEGYWEGRSGGDWEWDGKTWGIDFEIEDFYEAEAEGNWEVLEMVKERMRRRIEDIVARGES